MKHSRYSRPFVSLAVILVLALCLVGLVHGARAAGGKAAVKKAVATQPAAISVAPVASLTGVNPPETKLTAQSAAPPAAAKTEPTASPLATMNEAQPPDPSKSEPSPAPTLAPGAPNPAIVAATAPAAAVAELSSIPTGAGLPVMVDIGVFVLELGSFDDVKGEFEATTDLRLRWMDPRVRFKGKGLTNSYEEYRAKDAEERLAKLWTPNVDVANRVEQTGYVGHRLRIFSDGTVETIVRSTGRYKVDVDVQNFPFDVQALKQVLVIRDQTTDEVMLHFDKDDEEFSRAAGDAQIESWRIGDVDLDSDLVVGWNGDRYARVTASLVVSRNPLTGMTTIFIPLIASLLIPLLALWMNRASPEGFEIEAFELANMGIGGLFSVIALSYAVSSAYGTIAGSDNTVTRLFALNYATLALSLGIVVVLFRFNLIGRLFGPYVHQQAFRFLLWAVPLLTLSTAVAFVLVSAC